MTTSLSLRSPGVLGGLGNIERLYIIRDGAYQVSVQEEFSNVAHWSIGTVSGARQVTKLVDNELAGMFLRTTNNINYSQYRNVVVEWEAETVPVVDLNDRFEISVGFYGGTKEMSEGLDLAPQGVSVLVTRQGGFVKQVQWFDVSNGDWVENLTVRIWITAAYTTPKLRIYNLYLS